VTNNFLLSPFKGHSALGKLTHLAENNIKEATSQILNEVSRMRGTWIDKSFTTFMFSPLEKNNNILND
jgi:hypothetical protein